MTETTGTIAEWSRQTFGPVNPPAVVNRAMDEFLELHRAVDDGASPAAILEEIADVIIVLCRLGHEYGHVWEAIEAKMAVNRGRQWAGWRHVE